MILRLVERRRGSTREVRARRRHATPPILDVPTTNAKGWLVRSSGHLERDIMRAIWGSEQPVTGHEIADRLDKDIAYTTVITVVDRLREKGLLSRFRQGRSYRYLLQQRRCSAVGCQRSHNGKTSIG